MKAREGLSVALAMVLIAVPALALGALCERLVYDDGGLGGDDCGNMFPAFHQVLPRGEELAMFDCGMDTGDNRLVLVLLYAPNSGHHNPVFAQRWDVPTDASDEGSVQFAWGGHRCSMSIAFRDADVSHAHPSAEVCTGAPD